MGQNVSSAVMQQRTEAHDSLDDFPTPPWATRALCVWLQTHWAHLADLTAWEPCCNRGYMVLPMLEYFCTVRASDIELYPEYENLPGLPDRDVIDFATTGHTEPKVDWVFANPPFRLALEFIKAALAVSRYGVAMLVRTSYTEGAERYRELFADNRIPPSYVLVSTQRIVMLRGRLIRDGEPDPFNIDEKTGQPRKASTATSYVWLVWLKSDIVSDPRIRWLPPNRLELERPGDYPIYDIPQALAPAPLFDEAGEQA